MCTVLAEECVLGFQTTRCGGQSHIPMKHLTRSMGPQGRLEALTFFREQDSKAPT